MTATQVKIRRGTQAQIDVFTPVVGETVLNTTTKELHTGDGATLKGNPQVSAENVGSQRYVYCTVGGTADAITLTTTLVRATLIEGLKLVFKAASTNTGAVTINADGQGVRSARKLSSGSLVELAAGDIVSGAVYEVTYDGTQFQIAGTSIPTIPTQDPSGLVPLATASASNSMEFTSVIDGTYDHYVLMIDGLYVSTGSNLELQYSTNNGSSWSSSNYYDNITDTGGSTSSRVDLGIPASSTTPLRGRVDVYGLTSTSGHKYGHVNTVYGIGVGATNSRRKDSAFAFAITSAINALRLRPASGNILGNSATLYGMSNP